MRCYCCSVWRYRRLQFRKIGEFRLRQRIRLLDKIERRIKTRIPARKSQLQSEQSKNNGNTCKHKIAGGIVTLNQIYINIILSILLHPVGHRSV